ncbi:ATP-binding cassette sub-family C member 10-like [Diadema antillarum]|uniref:ATP-binding cassette sub-family C member 10-like n=1 Tax=Diadema antillarum TaxID=105358 RepID=UPI003A886A05
MMGNSMDGLCRRAPGNNTWQNDFYESHCYWKLMIFLPSHCLLAIVSAFYVIQITNEPNSPSVKQSAVLRIRFVIASLYALLQLLNVLLRQFPMDADFPSVEDRVDGLAFVAWFLLALYEWKLRYHGTNSVRAHKPVIAALFLTLLAMFSRLIIILLHVLSNSRAISVSEDGLVFVCTAFHFLYLISLFPVPKHTQNYRESGADDGSSGSARKTTGEEEPLQAPFPSTYETLKLDLGAGEDSASLLSKLTFWWIFPLLRKGAAVQLCRPEDVSHLPRQLLPSHVEARFATVYPQSSSAFVEDVFAAKELGASRGGGDHSEATISKVQTDRPSLLWAIMKMFGPQMCLLAFFKVGIIVLRFTGPLMLGELVFFIENGTEPKHHGYYYAIKFTLAIFLFGTLNCHYYHQLRMLVYKVHPAIVSVIYRKSLAVSATTLSAFTRGQIVNFMRSDSDVIVELPYQMQLMWALLVTVACSLYLIYRQVGVLFLIGPGLMMILIPITRYVSARMIEAHQLKSKQLDSTVKVRRHKTCDSNLLKSYEC